MAVCQPSVPVLAAMSLMEANGDRAVPHSLILMAGPIDTRVSPTVVNRLPRSAAPTGSSATSSPTCRGPIPA